MEPPKSPSPKRRKIAPKPISPKLYTPIYPSLSEDETPDSYEAPEQQGHIYRLQQIAHLKKELLEEREKRSSLYKKYHRGVNVIDDTALVSASVGMGIGGVGLLCTIIAAPIVLALEYGSLV